MPACILRLFIVIGHTIVLAGFFGGGCDRKSSPPGGGPSVPSKGSAHAVPAVASLVPAATDLLLGMGAGDHLVAVSNQEANPQVPKDLPRVGDYQGTDWEMLATLRPAVLVCQMAPEKLPEGFRQRCAMLNIKLVNVRLNSLEDIYAAITTLATAAGEAGKGVAFAQELRGRIDAVAARVKDRPPVPTLLALGESGVVGPHNYLDDLLTKAGGRNVAAPLAEPWPAVDRERAATLRPEVILLLQPDARPDAVDLVRRFWQSVSAVPATRDGKFHHLSQWYALLPGSHVADVTEQLARLLHPECFGASDPGGSQ